MIPILRNKLYKHELLSLFLILGLAFCISFIPHISYPYPLHIDEWFHAAYSKALVAEGSISHINPFVGDSSQSIDLETGFHVLLGALNQTTGIPWIDIFRFFPSIFFVFTVLSVYLVGRKMGYGWEAGFFACFIPSSVRLLGPTFLVPVSLGLMFLALSVYIVAYHKRKLMYPLLFILSAFVLVMHPPTAVGLLIIIFPFVLFYLKGESKHALGVLFAILLPFALVVWIAELLLPTAKSLLSVWPLNNKLSKPRTIIFIYGYIPTFLWVLGIIFMINTKKKMYYALSLGSLILYAFILIYALFDLGVPIFYERSHMYLMLVMSLAAGYGLMRLRKIRFGMNGTIRTSYVLIRKTGMILFSIIIVLALVFSSRSSWMEQYYHMIDDYDYQSFVWIRDNLEGDYDHAILDPWKATAFAAVTQKDVYSRLHVGINERVEATFNFLSSGCTNTEFLRNNGISIVYTLGSCNNPDLAMVRENIYVLIE